MTRMMLLVSGMGVLFVVLIGAAWERIGGAPMSTHGWIALGVGVMGTALLAGGLMALAFHSSRSGHDDWVEKTEDVNERIRRRF